MLEIIYEDDDILALNKPAGVLFDWALSERPGLIPAHRLDRETSGVIVFAKNEKAREYLKNIFKDRQIKKTYLALAAGHVKNDSGVIDFDIGRSKRSPLKRIAVGKKRGKIREAVTEYKVKNRFGVKEGGFTLLEVFPKTGRTHQIRSHFSAIGHPVACDKMYGGKKPKCPAGLSRQFLHSKSLEFTLPSGARTRLEANIPGDLERVLRELSKSDTN